MMRYMNGAANDPAALIYGQRPEGLGLRKCIRIIGRAVFR